MRSDILFKMIIERKRCKGRQLLAMYKAINKGYVVATAIGNEKERRQYEEPNVGLLPTSPRIDYYRGEKYELASHQI